MPQACACPSPAMHHGQVGSPSLGCCPPSSACSFAKSPPTACFQDTLRLGAALVRPGATAAAAVAPVPIPPACCACWLLGAPGTPVEGPAAIDDDADAARTRGSAGWGGWGMAGKPPNAPLEAVALLPVLPCCMAASAVCGLGELPGTACTACTVVPPYCCTAGSVRLYCCRAAAAPALPGF